MVQWSQEWKVYKPNGQCKCLQWEIHPDDNTLHNIMV
jgi:hypothetical protein